jgi:hypothetical protein
MNGATMRQIAHQAGYYLSHADAELLAEERAADPDATLDEIVGELAAEGYIELVPLAAPSHETQQEYEPPDYHEQEANRLADQEEARLGRQLTQTEFEQLGQAYDRAVDSGGQVEFQPHDTSTRQGRIALMNQRHADNVAGDNDNRSSANPATPDAIAPLRPGASRAERIAYMDAVHAGAHVDPDLTPTTETEE